MQKDTKKQFFSPNGKYFVDYSADNFILFKTSNHNRSELSTTYRKSLNEQIAFLYLTNSHLLINVQSTSQLVNKINKIQCFLLDDQIALIEYNFPNNISKIKIQSALHLPSSVTKPNNRNNFALLMSDYSLQLLSIDPQQQFTTLDILLNSIEMGQSNEFQMPWNKNLQFVIENTSPASILLNTKMLLAGKSQCLVIYAPNTRQVNFINLLANQHVTTFNSEQVLDVEIQPPEQKKNNDGNKDDDVLFMLINANNKIFVQAHCVSDLLETINNPIFISDSIEDTHEQIEQSECTSSSNFSFHLVKLYQIPASVPSQNIIVLQFIDVNEKEHLLLITESKQMDLNHKYLLEPIRLNDERYNITFKRAMLLERGTLLSKVQQGSIAFITEQSSIANKAETFFKVTPVYFRFRQNICQSVDHAQQDDQVINVSSFHVNQCITEEQPMLMLQQGGFMDLFEENTLFIRIDNEDMIIRNFISFENQQQMYQLNQFQFAQSGNDSSNAGQQEELRRRKLSQYFIEAILEKNMHYILVQHFDSDSDTFSQQQKDIFIENLQVVLNAIGEQYKQKCSFKYINDQNLGKNEMFAFLENLMNFATVQRLIWNYIQKLGLKEIAYLNEYQQVCSKFDGLCDTYRLLIWMLVNSNFRSLFAKYYDKLSAKWRIKNQKMDCHVRYAEMSKKALKYYQKMPNEIFLIRSLCPAYPCSLIQMFDSIQDNSYMQNLFIVYYVICDLKELDTKENVIDFDLLKNEFFKHASLKDLQQDSFQSLFSGYFKMDSLIDPFELDESGNTNSNQPDFKLCKSNSDHLGKQIIVLLNSDLSSRWSEADVNGQQFLQELLEQAIIMFAHFGQRLAVQFLVEKAVKCFDKSKYVNLMINVELMFGMAQQLLLKLREYFEAVVIVVVGELQKLSASQFFQEGETFLNLALNAQENEILLNFLSSNDQMYFLYINRLLMTGQLLKAIQFYADKLEYFAQIYQKSIQLSRLKKVLKGQIKHSNFEVQIFAKFPKLKFDLDCNESNDMEPEEIAEQKQLFDKYNQFESLLSHESKRISDAIQNSLRKEMQPLNDRMSDAMQIGQQQNNYQVNDENQFDMLRCDNDDNVGIIPMADIKQYNVGVVTRSKSKLTGQNQNVLFQK